MKNSLFSFFLIAQLYSLGQNSLPCKHHKKAPLNADLLTRSNHYTDSIDVLNYQINLDFREASNKKIKGNCKILFKSLVANLISIQLDLLKLTIDSVVFDNTPLSFQYNDTVVNSSFNAPLLVGDTNEITIYYGGTPQQDAQWGGFYFSGHYAFNLGVGFDANPHNYGRVWFPCKDNFTDRATFEFFILTTQDKKAVCNGQLISEIPIGTDSVLFYWKQEEPIPTYLACVAVANYQILESMHQGVNGPIPVLLAAEAADTSKLKASFLNLGNAINAFEQHYGPYNWNKVGYSLVPFNAGAMEHASNIAYPRYAANGNLTYETLMAHELSHHWWGNLVTCETAEDMWINEGMASFSEYLFTENIYGKEAYKQVIQSDLDEVLHSAHIKEKGYLPISGIPHEFTYGIHVYTKGALVAHTLRSYMGDSSYFASVSAFLQNNKFKDVNSELLQSELTNSSGFPLNDFFENWVYKGGFPHFSIDSVQINNILNEFKIHVYVQQKLKGATEYFSNVPMEFLFIDANNTKHYHTEFLSGVVSDFEIKLPFPPIYWEINPNSKISQAVSKNTKTINSTGNVNFDLARLNLTVTSIQDSAFLTIAHNWVKPDEFKIQHTDLKISDYRYWQVDGILPTHFKASTKFYYDGRPNLSGLNGLLDNGFIGNAEDSIVFLYRKDASEDWREVIGAVQNTLGSNTPKYGYFQTDSLLKGQYTFAYGNKNGLAIQPTAHQSTALLIHPNPARNFVEIAIQNDKIISSIELYDLYGKKVKSYSFPEKKFKLPTEDLINGAYILYLKDAENNKYTGKIIIEH